MFDISLAGIAGLRPFKRLAYVAGDILLPIVCEDVDVLNIPEEREIV